MDEYRASYFTLFNGITDALVMLEQQNIGLAKERLIRAQQQAEDRFIHPDSEPE